MKKNLLLLGSIIVVIAAATAFINLETSCPTDLHTASTVAAEYGDRDFSLSTLNGETIRLSQFGGKVVLVTIWAPWCGPCRVETPGFVKLYDQYHDRGFEIIGVAVQTNEKDVRSFVEKYDIQWPVGLNDDVAISYGTYALPDNYLFGPDGKLLKRFVGLTKEEVLKPLIQAALPKAIRAGSL